MSDLISRQDAIDAIVAWTVEDRPDIEMPTDLVDRVNALPSAYGSLMQDRCKIDASSDLIRRQALRDAMYHEAFETDTDMQRWDSGCWIRYKLFETVIDNLPSAER